MLENGKALVDAILHRSGEPPDASSAMRPAALQYLNRGYQSLSAGTSEFLPELVDDWWWTRRKSLLTLLPIFETGISVGEGSSQAVLTGFPVLGNFELDENLLFDSNDVPIDITGWRIRIGTDSDVFVVAAHDPGNVIITLDMNYTGKTREADCKAMKVKYDLDEEVSALISPVIEFRRNLQIDGMNPERMDELYPLARLDSGMPEAFALEDEQTIRFSHGGPTNDRPARIEYRYRPVVTDLTDDTSSAPLVPQPYRSILIDMALVYMFQDKGDRERASAAAIGSKQNLLAMVRENRRRATKMDSTSGKIIPRPGRQHRLLTESGLRI